MKRCSMSFDHRCGDIDVPSIDALPIIAARRRAIDHRKASRYPPSPRVADEAMLDVVR
jgi:hypothetical protein